MKASLCDLAVWRVSGRGAAPPAVEVETVLAGVEAVLDGNSLCALATVTPDSRAHASTVYFAWTESLRLYFVSHPDSLHARNLAHHPSAAISVYSSAQQWGGPDRGLQLFGDCALLAESQLEKAERVYAARFPGYAAQGESLSDLRFFAFTTARLQLLDELLFGDGVFVSCRVEAPAEGT